ncbi:MAG: FAD-dependent monooxygenase [Phycisphaerales bacterium]|nr:FAD-dependent monooxygenase [Phycisphaerales bacterium]
MIHPIDITVVGGGLVGPAFACMAADLGHRVTLIEHRADPRAAGYAGGRSINLALSHRGLEALQEIGLASTARDIGIPMEGREIHSPEGQLSFQRYSAIPGEAILSISRGQLNCLLLDAMDRRSTVKSIFNTAIESIDLDTATVQLSDSQVIGGDLIIGADGAGSMVRAVMDQISERESETEFIDARYKELHIPPTENGQWRMSRQALHIWPRGEAMMIALPNLDGSFTVTCFWPKSMFEEVKESGGIMSYFSTVYPDAVAHMPNLETDFQDNPESLLGTVRCHHFNYGSTAALIGDAAHAIVPFFGQGMNAGLQGSLQLKRAMASETEVDSALARYDSVHRPDALAIADLALKNYVEMRSHTASAAWRLKTRFQKQLNRMFPNAYQPLYNLISFSSIRYSEAVSIVNRRHQRLLLAVVASVILMVMLLLAAATML